MNTTNETETTTLGRFRPSLSFYHPNAKGTGCALQMTLHPAHDHVDGSIFMSIANQISTANLTNGESKYSRFDWENKICVKLDFNDLCGFLQVLRGECESIGGGKGLFHQHNDTTTQIRFSHILEPEHSYRLDVTRSSGKGVKEKVSRFYFNQSEALGLSEALAGSMAIVCFGIPMLIARKASMQSKGLNNDNAA